MTTAGLFHLGCVPVAVAIVRSPNYPAISLPKALELIEKVYKREHTHKCPPDVIASALGYSGLNGASLTVISALKKYGLLDEVDKQLKVSADALTILVEPPGSNDRVRALIRAAYAPALFAELQKEFPAGLPSDENLRAYLLRHQFSPNTVNDPIRSYRDTIAFVTNARAMYNAPETPPEAERLVPSEGDLVRWESSGVLQLESPRRVRAIQEHDGKKWVFVEGSESGMPMEEVIVEEAREFEGMREQVRPKLPLPPPIPSEASALTGDESEWLRGRLSSTTKYRLIVAGQMGPKEIGKLIKLLAAQQAVLSEDDDELLT